MGGNLRVELGTSCNNAAERDGGIQLSRVQTTRNARRGGGFPGGWLVVQQILNQRRSESGWALELRLVDVD